MNDKTQKFVLRSAARRALGRLKLVASACNVNFSRSQALRTLSAGVLLSVAAVSAHAKLLVPCANGSDAVMWNSVSGSFPTSALDLKKEVRNVTQAGTFGVNNQAKSGETLEYRITYTNNATTPISGMSINDQVPSFTTFVSALTGTTPSGFTACAKTTPANPAPAPSVSCASAQAAGGTGAIDWKFTGVLNPGDTGTVLFTVKVD